MTDLQVHFRAEPPPRIMVEHDQGFTYGFLFPTEDLTGSVLYVHDIYVEEQSRRRRIGEKLLHTLMQEALNHDAVQYAAIPVTEEGVAFHAAYFGKTEIVQLHQRIEMRLETALAALENPRRPK